MFADATMTELINLADKTIEEITVVTNHDKRSVEIEQGLFQHILRYRLLYYKKQGSLLLWTSLLNALRVAVHSDDLHAR